MEKLKTLLSLGEFKGAWGIKAGTIYMAFSYTLTTLFIFGFQTIAVRLLQPDQYGLVSVLYSSVVFVSLFLGQTFELAISKYLSEYQINGRSYFVLVQRIWLWQSLTLLFFIFLSILFRDRIINGLFPEIPEYYYLFVACGVFYSIEISLRGVMRGLRNIGVFGTLSISLHLFRIVYLLIFVGLFEFGLMGAGFSIFLASFTNLVLIFAWFRSAWGELTGEPSKNQELTFWQLGKYIIPTMAMFGFSTYFYNTGPSFIKLVGGVTANETAGLFLIAVMISRLPLQLSEAFSVNLLPNMSRLVVLGDWRQIKYYIKKSYQIFIPISLVSIIGIYWLGPFVLRIIYPDFVYNRLGLAVLVLGTSVIMLVAAFIQFLLAYNKVSNIVMGWVVAGLILTIIVIYMPGDILTRLETGYLAGALSIWACLGVFTYQALNQMKANNKELSQEASL